jgi:hypothetical protein
LIDFVVVEPGSLVGVDEFVLDMSSKTQLPSPDQGVLVDVRGPGEWIVGVPGSRRSLHVYRLERADWLVSEVGCGNEGRGSDLTEALAALSAAIQPPDWWELVPRVLDSD